MTKWYDDKGLVDALPFRYRAYAVYSRLFGEDASRRVPGGSFMLRMIRDASALTGASTVARVHGINRLVVVTDFGDERVLEVVHEIRGENPEYRVMQSLLSPGATFVDVGANFGTFSLLASRIVGTEGRVIALEPQEKLASLIEESCSLSGIGNCEVRRVACGSESGNKTLLIPAHDSGRAGFFGAFSGKPGHASHNVTISTIDSMLETVDAACMIKIDVEGSEMDVLDGAVDTLRRLRPSIIVELNPWSARAAGREPKEIIDRLASHGYSSFATADSYPAKADISRMNLDRQLNLIAWQ